MFEKELIIDGKGHLQGRLASIVAKELVGGQRVTVVRCESILKSGSLVRNKIIRRDMMKKRINTKPRRGAKHWLAPSRIFWKVTRGMLPHKTPRGAAALDRLKCFDGIPFPYDQKKRMVVPEALKVLRIRPQRSTCELGELASHCGWTRSDVVETLEEKRKAKSAKYWDNKQKKAKAKAGLANHKDVKAVSAELAKYGF